MAGKQKLARLNLVVDVLAHIVSATHLRKKTKLIVGISLFQKIRAAYNLPDPLQQKKTSHNHVSKEPRLI